MSTSTENQTNVFHAPVSFKISFHVKTPVSNSNANAINAVNVASTWIKLPVTHNANATIKIPVMNFSAMDIGPILANSFSAHCLALGVSFTVGGYIL
ncbi:Uncharacterised protein [Streptococcus pneumoniae]|nr:Uncharacterised protein [Streptococcus pneumoniae]